jgi:hypothetical protein
MLNDKIKKIRQKIKENILPYKLSKLVIRDIRSKIPHIEKQ